MTKFCITANSQIWHITKVCTNVMSFSLSVANVEFHQGNTLKDITDLTILVTVFGTSVYSTLQIYIYILECGP